MVNMNWEIQFEMRMSLILILFDRRVRGESNLRMETIERQLYRLRDKEHPPIPETNEEIQTTLRKPVIFEEYGKAFGKNNPHFYLGSDINENYAFHVFVSFDCVNMTEKYITPEHRNYSMDGTFNITPSKFQQLLIISIEYKNDVRIFIIDGR